MPLVSVGIPVFNGSNYIKQAIESVLKQSYADIELLISDNCSTDNTYEICKSYMESDPRIILSRNESNLGAAPNFNKVFHLASGKYFMWLSHDDYIELNFIKECINILELSSSTVLCQSNLSIIDENNNFLKAHKLQQSGTDKLSKTGRFKNFVLNDQSCYEVFGVIRRDVLAQTSLIQSHISSDRHLIAELSLLGSFSTIEEYLFNSREHQERSIRKYPVQYLRAQWFDSSNSQNIRYPFWKVFFKYFSIVKQYEIECFERWKLYFVLLLWPFVNLNIFRLGLDMILSSLPLALRNEKILIRLEKIVRK